MRFEYFLTLLKHRARSSATRVPGFARPRSTASRRSTSVPVNSIAFNHPSILDVPEDATALASALADLPEHALPCQHFGTGQSAARFMQALRQPSFWTAPRQKQFRDLRFADELDRRDFSRLKPPFWRWPCS